MTDYEIAEILANRLGIRAQAPNYHFAKGRVYRKNAVGSVVPFNPITNGGDFDETLQHARRHRVPSICMEAFFWHASDSDEMARRRVCTGLAEHYQDEVA